ncbi:UDP-glucuronosyltransferase 2A1-like isoform X2 [Denticeps clupeoides]|uniref:UDP-glucuronosyltransferase 2A1-like isoform X2 n=1 Tax=Denticeps clupeoides TaxID=299321 RepID=UPI0010A3FBC8|nr:UDP-glucuronosyltransferase 2A1-like isoform X2 [Denticeps clupeoides]
MISIHHFCFILQSILLFGFQNVQSGNVLILPGEFSHWHNMHVIVEELVERNHSVTVLVSTASTTVNLTTYRICGQMPSTPSYTPTQPVHFTDRMNFQERVQNFLQYIFHTLMFFAVMHVQMQNIYTDIKGEPPLMCEPFGKTEIWLMRSYWDWDYPLPFPPNFVFIGGHHCKPPKPLPKDMEQFVQSSGDDGIVVFSLYCILLHDKT